ncbi:MAG: serine/threonine-protein kinase [Euzebya sp.]
MPSTDSQLIAGRYQLAQLLGQGGAGQVWHGLDTVLGRPVAVKVMHGLLAGDTAEDGSLDGRDRDRVMREARAAARLQHPGAVAIYDVVEHQGRLHLVMELVQAPTLADRVAADGPLSDRRVAQIGLELLDVLDAAHAIGVVHRDVKPSNVLVPEHGMVRLTDFGTAVMAGEDRLTASDMVIGSPAYMAPEQATDQNAGPAADRWSLGATLYHAVEGVPPFSSPSAIATMHAVVHDRPRPPVQAGMLAPVIQRLLVHDPSTRADSAEVRALLQAAVSGRMATALMPADRAQPQEGQIEFSPALRGGESWRRAVPWVAAVVGIVVAIGLFTTIDRDATVTTTEPSPSTPEGAVVDPTAEVVLPDVTVAATPETVEPSDDRNNGNGNGNSNGNGNGNGREEADSQLPTGVPADWVAYQPEDAPYRVYQPPSWTTERLDATRTDISDPTSSAYLRLDWTADPAPDPLADWQAYEPSFAEGHTGYERIRMEPTTFDGQPAALWEYIYTAGGTPVHAYNLNVSGTDYGYALNYQASEADWAAAEPLFSNFMAGYDIVG